MNYFFTQFFLTKKCNQDCYYCIRKEVSKESVEIDTDLVANIICNIKKNVSNVFIELSGGEPGLVSNLPDLIHLLKKFECRIRLMSNGLVRIRFSSIITDVDEYYEHLIFDVRDDKIIKFYDLNFIDFNNCFNVVVETSSVLKSKKYNELHHIIPNLKLRKLIYNENEIEFKRTKERELCMKLTPIITFDLENKLIYHCSKYIGFFENFSKKLDKENIQKAIQKKLFSTEFPYCYLLCKSPYIGVEKYQTHYDLLNTNYNRIL